MKFETKFAREFRLPNKEMWKAVGENNSLGFKNNWSNYCLHSLIQKYFTNSLHDSEVWLSSAWKQQGEGKYVFSINHLGLLHLYIWQGDLWTKHLKSDILNYFIDWFSFYFSIPITLVFGLLTLTYLLGILSWTFWLHNSCS